MAVIVDQAPRWYDQLPGRFDSGRGAAWLARLLWEQEVASSNLAAPTLRFVKNRDFQ